MNLSHFTEGCPIKTKRATMSVCFVASVTQDKYVISLTHLKAGSLGVMEMQMLAPLRWPSQTASGWAGMVHSIMEKPLTALGAVFCSLFFKKKKRLQKTAPRAI